MALSITQVALGRSTSVSSGTFSAAVQPSTATPTTISQQFAGGSATPFSGSVGGGASMTAVDAIEQNEGGQAFSLAKLKLEIEDKSFLDSLGMPKEGWYCLQNKSLDALTMQELTDILALKEATKDVSTLISFGAANGGFEFAVAVQHGLMQKHGDMSYSKHYVDATSLRHHPSSSYSKIKEDIDVYKMNTPYWDIAYKSGMNNAKSMIFFITPEWLNSSYCKQELDWFQSAQNQNIKAVFVIFREAANHPHIGVINQFVDNNPDKCVELCVENIADPSLAAVSIDKHQNLSFKYAINTDTWKSIIQM